MISVETCEKVLKMHMENRHSRAVIGAVCYVGIATISNITALKSAAAKEAAKNVGYTIANTGREERLKEKVLKYIFADGRKTARQVSKHSDISLPDAVWLLNNLVKDKKIAVIKDGDVAYYMKLTRYKPLDVLRILAKSRM